MQLRSGQLVDNNNYMLTVLYTDSNYQHGQQLFHDPPSAVGVSAIADNAMLMTIGAFIEQAVGTVDTTMIL